jgi:hypothetical protein
VTKRVAETRGEDETVWMVRGKRILEQRMEERASTNEELQARRLGHTPRDMAA